MQEVEMNPLDIPAIPRFRIIEVDFSARLPELRLDLGVSPIETTQYGDSFKSTGIVGETPT